MITWIKKKWNGKHVHTESATNTLNKLMMHLYESDAGFQENRSKHLLDHLFADKGSIVPVQFQGWKYKILMEDGFIVEDMREGFTGYRITSKGKRFLKNGGYIPYIVRPTPMPLTNNQKRERRRAFTERIEYYKALFWLATIIIGVPTVIHGVGMMFGFDFFAWLKSFVAA